MRTKQCRGSLTYEQAVSYIQTLYREEREGKLTRYDVIQALDDKVLRFFLFSQVNESDDCQHIATGCGVSLGAATGKVCLSTSSAEQALQDGKAVILFKSKLSADDARLFADLSGIISTNEDPTSHFTIYARALAKPFITNVSNAAFDEKSTTLLISGRPVIHGQWVSMDGISGKIYLGQAKVREPKWPWEYFQIEDWIRQEASVLVGGYADSTPEATEAYKEGAFQAWSRTEALLYAGPRLNLFQKIVTKDDKPIDESALQSLLSLLEHDFTQIYRAMKGRSVAIRLLDPPVNEFMPSTEASKMALAKDLGITFTQLEERITQLHEDNPMSGHRGVRLIITHPALAKVQIRAIFNAVLAVRAEGLMVDPRILIPMVVDPREIMAVKRLIAEVYDSFGPKEQEQLSYSTGVVIETPRAAYLADQLAREVQFVSFGTNDLTAQIFAFSRGDVFRKFLGEYLERGILEKDPFYELDDVVLSIIGEAVQRIRTVDPLIPIDICGEQGSHPKVIEFCHHHGITSVSCAPSRIRSAWLRSAKAALGQCV